MKENVRKLEKVWNLMLIAKKSPKISFAEKDLGVLVATKLNMRQQCTIATKKSNAIPGLHQEGCYRKIEGGYPFLYSALMRPHLSYWVQFWVFQYKRDMDILEKVEQRFQ